MKGLSEDLRVSRESVASLLVSRFVLLVTVCRAWLGRVVPVPIVTQTHVAPLACVGFPERAGEVRCAAARLRSQPDRCRPQHGAVEVDLQGLLGILDILPRLRRAEAVVSSGDVQVCKDKNHFVLFDNAYQGLAMSSSRIDNKSGLNPLAVWIAITQASLRATLSAMSPRSASSSTTATSLACARSVFVPCSGLFGAPLPVCCLPCRVVCVPSVLPLPWLLE
jgi:hypothetical protein